MSRKRVLLKVVLLGDSGVGKSAISRFYCENTFDATYKPTIGADFVSKELQVDGQQVTLQIWDTAGQERFATLGTAFYRGSDCCVLVCDLTDAASLGRLGDWLDQFRVHASPDTPVVVFANKCDLADKRALSAAQLQGWCKANGVEHLFETSAKAGIGIEPAFLAVARQQRAADCYAAPDAVVLCGAPAVKGPRLGLSVGGARDAGNFRDRLRNGVPPKRDGITYEGVFAEYAFDTRAAAPPPPAGRAGEPPPLFQPTYAFARSAHPLTGETEHFVSIGLNSTLDATSFSRRSLVLVILLDVSGSMESPFSSFGRESKLQLAKESIREVVARLDERKQDRVGLAVFSGSARVILNVTPVGASTGKQVQLHLEQLGAEGSTNMEEGLRLTTTMLERTQDADVAAGRGAVEYRLVVVTDDQPNVGSTGGLVRPLRANADRGLHASFIGVGVDFDPTLVTQLTTVPGANYFSVQSGRELRQRLVTEFDYLVTPLVFDLKVSMESAATTIGAVYGSPNADAATGSFMYVASLFPSVTTDKGTKGGIILAKLQVGDPEDAQPLRITASWRDVAGTPGQCTHEVAPPWRQHAGDFFADAAVRKGVALVRYVGLVRAVVPERAYAPGPPPPAVAEQLAGMRAYLERERRAVRDRSLRQEEQVLTDLLQPRTGPRRRFC